MNMLDPQSQLRSDAGPALAVVIIGRNEGERLRRCLLSVEGINYPEGSIELVYGDTACRDGSAEMMESVGVAGSIVRPVSLPNGCSASSESPITSVSL